MVSTARSLRQEGRTPSDSSTGRKLSFGEKLLMLQIGEAQAEEVLSENFSIEPDGLLVQTVSAQEMDVLMELVTSAD